MHKVNVWMRACRRSGAASGDPDKFLTQNAHCPKVKFCSNAVEVVCEFNLDLYFLQASRFSCTPNLIQTC